MRTYLINFNSAQLFQIPEMLHAQNIFRNSVLSIGLNPQNKKKIRQRQNDKHRKIHLFSKKNPHDSFTPPFTNLNFHQ